MVTIIGSGIGASKLSRIKADLSVYDVIVCDKSFDTDTAHPRVISVGFLEARNYLLENGESENIGYIVTGSPFFYSGAASVIRCLREACIPFSVISAESSKDYLVRALQIPENEIVALSLHGREALDLRAFMSSKYTFLLCDERTPSKVAAIVKYLPKEAYKITYASKMGTDEEKIEEVCFEELSERDWAGLCPFVLLIEKLYEDRKPYTNDDELEYERGMYTKQYKRGLILQTLELAPNQTLWDVGAGSGSVSIEAFKSRNVHAVMFEKNDERRNILERNLSSHFVLSARVCRGEALENISKEPDGADRIFVGGGGANVAKNLPALKERLKKDGILVAAYVSMGHLALAIDSLCNADIEYELKSISLTTYKEPLKISEPERQMFLLKVRK